MQKKSIGLKIPPCFAPLLTVKVEENTAFQETWVTCLVYIFNNKHNTVGGRSLFINQRKSLQ